MILGVDLRTMQYKFFNKKLLLDNIIKDKIQLYIPDDTYYISLKGVYQMILELSTWLFNFCDKRSKIIELFAGIGQCSLFLHELGLI